ncbi:MAG: PilZ domain-containing protein [Candidatus Tantalella remota]|nr:PilZ domain-containing protein [Candidatus Tantalella remota]
MRFNGNGQLELPGKMEVREVTEKTDNRKYTRVKTHVPVRYRKLRDGAGIIGASSITKNLSEGGIRFRTAEFISMACRLILELDIPMFTKPVKAISKVAWIRKVPSGDDYEVGNQFLEMSKKDQELMSEYVDSLEMYNDADNSDDGADTEISIQASVVTEEDQPKDSE